MYTYNTVRRHRWSYEGYREIDAFALYLKGKINDLWRIQGVDLQKNLGDPKTCLIIYKLISLLPLNNFYSGT